MEWIKVTIHKHNHLKGMIDIESDDFIYSSPNPEMAGMQCNFKDGTKEHDILAEQLIIIEEATRKILNLKGK